MVKNDIGIGVAFQVDNQPHRFLQVTDVADTGNALDSLAFDEVGNLLELDPLALAGAALPTDLEVECGGGPAGSVLLFTSQTTAIWDAVSGAFFYNIYRGNISGLVDGNFDGQPDGGYGTCWTANDPNPADTTLMDGEVPTVPGDGFHYLVSWRTLAGDEGLGANSAGVARVVSVPCP